MKSTKNSWNLKLLYKNDKDPQIEKDVRGIEKVFSDFEKKYKGKDFTSSSKKLKAALGDYSKLEKALNGHKPWWYFHLKADLNSEDNNAQAKSAQYMQRYAQAANKITFFRLELGKIPKAKQQKFLKDKDLKDYWYLLKITFDRAHYHLTEKEEELASLLSQPSYDMWVEGQDKLVTQQLIAHEGKSIPIAQASSLIADLPKGKRRELHGAVIKTLRSISGFSEAEINAICNYKKLVDERRGFEKPYSATVLHYENEEGTVKNLVKLVTKNFHIAHRFYKLHAKLLREKKITLADRSVKIGKIDRKFNFQTAVDIVRSSFSKFDKKYSDILDKYLENGQIDVYPAKGKTGGAYCSHHGDNPTFVLLNHTDSIRWVETLAHEMGHAFHGEHSMSQPVHYRDYTIATAEVASTFFEQMVLEDLQNELSDKEKIILIHNRIMGDVSTIFRQIACFNFENELHLRIRKEGKIPAEEITKLMVKHLKSYLGDAVKVTEDDGYTYVSWPHIRYFFYVYSYAYGQLISRALFEKWKEDKSYAKKIEQFLRAGGSMSPEDIFKSIGIDTSDPKFFQTGLKAIEKDIDKLEKLSKKVK